MASKPRESCAGFEALHNAGTPTSVGSPAAFSSPAPHGLVGQLEHQLPDVVALTPRREGGVTASRRAEARAPAYRRAPPELMRRCHNQWAPSTRDIFLSSVPNGTCPSLR